MSPSTDAQEPVSCPGCGQQTTRDGARNGEGGVVTGTQHFAVKREPWTAQELWDDRNRVNPDPDFFVHADGYAWGPSEQHRDPARVIRPALTYEYLMSLTPEQRVAFTAKLEGDATRRLQLQRAAVQIVVYVATGIMLLGVAWTLLGLFLGTP